MSALFNFGRSQGRPRGPRGRRAYVIGDVHGCLDQLERLLSLIEEELEERSTLKSHIVFLGDLIDRGPASAQVVERLRTYSPASASTHFVMGNDEEVMLRVLSGEAEFFPSWLKFGGAETLRSYGLDPEELDGLTPAERLDRVKSAVPVDHVEFVKSFSDSISFGGYVFVHAGIRPGVELREQAQADLRWIREPFLADETDHGFTVVHGHTIANQVEVTRNRIGIDTGAFCTGTLTALAIEGSKRWLLQASAHAAERVQMDSLCDSALYFRFPRQSYYRATVGNPLHALAQDFGVCVGRRSDLESIEFAALRISSLDNDSRKPSDSWVGSLHPPPAELRLVARSERSNLDQSSSRTRRLPRLPQSRRLRRLQAGTGWTHYRGRLPRCSCLTSLLGRCALVAMAS